MTTKHRPPVPFVPEVGKIYQNHGGGTFKCIQSGAAYSFVNVRSGWTFNVRGPRRYADGTIDWQWSYGGRFERVEQ